MAMMDFGFRSITVLLKREVNIYFDLFLFLFFYVLSYYYSPWLLIYLTCICLEKRVFHELQTKMIFNVLNFHY